MQGKMKKYKLRCKRKGKKEKSKLNNKNYYNNKITSSNNNKIYRNRIATIMNIFNRILLLKINCYSSKIINKTIKIKKIK